MPVSDLSTLLDRHQQFVQGFASGNLGPPRLAARVLTCLDARVDPTHFLALELGDAFVIRNAGGRVTPAVTRDLGILSVLAPKTGASGAPPELAIIHHTDCGLGRLADGPTREQVAQQLGLSEDEVAALAVVDPQATVRADIELLRAAPEVPDALVVSGHVYDVRSGTLEQVVAPAPLRAP